MELMAYLFAQSRQETTTTLYLVDENVELEPFTISTDPANVREIPIDAMASFTIDEICEIWKVTRLPPLVLPDIPLAWSALRRASMIDSVLHEPWPAGNRSWPRLQQHSLEIVGARAFVPRLPARHFGLEDVMMSYVLIWCGGHCMWRAFQM